MTFATTETAAGRANREYWSIGAADRRLNDQQAVVRCAIEHSSLFALTTGLRVLEFSRKSSCLRVAFMGVLNDVNYTLVRVVEQKTILLHILSDTTAGPDLDVIVLNHIFQGIPDDERSLILNALERRLRPNGILIISDFADTSSERSPQDTGRQLCVGSDSIISVEELPPFAASDAGNVVHAVIVLRPRITINPPLFLFTDYAFNLRKSFGRSLEAGQEFGVYAGKWNLVVGRSGSGKTSFLRALQGEMPSYTPGARGFPRRRYFNMPQNVDVFDLLSPVQNVRAFGGSRADALNTFEALGMAPEFQARRDTVGISGGERQRLIVAQILAADPELLILDEPSKGLDRAGRLLIFNALAKKFHSSSGAPPTVVCADHDFAAFYRLFDYVFEIGHGMQTLVWTREADPTSDERLSQAATG